MNQRSSRLPSLEKADCINFPNLRVLVAEKASNTFLYAVIVASVGALGVLVYVLYDQFFSEDSPQKIYTK